MQDVLMHEVAHILHYATKVPRPDYFDRVTQAYESARKTGLWNGTYASVNEFEYFAVGRFRRSSSIKQP